MLLLLIFLLALFILWKCAIKFRKSAASDQDNADLTNKMVPEQANTLHTSINSEDKQPQLPIKLPENSADKFNNNWMEEPPSIEQVL